MITRTGRLSIIRQGSHQRLVVFGDIHGDLKSLEAGLAKRRPGDICVFLGDYADRGPHGVEVIERIDSLLDSEPDFTVALKGNHEDYSADGRPIFRPCTLVGEAVAKRGSWERFFSGFTEFLAKLSIAAIVPGSLLFVHGGIHGSLKRAEALVAPSGELEEEVLWSDPGVTTGMSPRGIGHRFGVETTRAVCADLGVRVIVRSHEPRKAIQGPCVEHSGMVVTTSSSTGYGAAAFVLVIDPTASTDGTTLAAAALPL